MNKINEFKIYVEKYGLGYTLTNVSFKCLTSLRVGGTCALVYIPNSLEDLVLSIKYLKKLDIKYFIIGNGTNLLINDRYFNEVTISLKKINKYKYLETKDDLAYIYAEAGVKGATLSKYISNMNISGSEFMSVIPGTIGGLTYMNAGAYKRSMSDIIESITYMDDAGDIYTIQSDNAEFGYRHSIFKENNYIILSVIIQLKLVNDFTEKPMDKIKRYITKKKESQPVNTINAGSVFKNKDIASWEIIDKLGYRGYIYNDAKVNELHANFIENLGNATFNDIMYLINIIKLEAKEKLNIDMECEWEIIE